MKAQVGQKVTQEGLGYNGVVVRIINDLFVEVRWEKWQGQYFHMSEHVDTLVEI